MSVRGVTTAQGRIFTCPWFVFLIAAVLSVAFGSSGIAAGPPRALPAGEIPADTRLDPLKGERGDFSFVPAQSPQQWEQRAEYVRRVMLVTLGLWPVPTKTPLKPVIHGLIDQGDYTIEKVYFESVPRFFVTGNLYRPKAKTGKLPAVMSPHGHFQAGDFRMRGSKQFAERSSKAPRDSRTAGAASCSHDASNWPAWAV